MSVMLRLVCCFVYVSKVRKKTGELTYCLLTVLKPKCKKKNIYFCQADSFHTDSFSFADIGCNLAQLLLRFNVSVRTYMQFIHYMHIYMYINLWVFLLIFFFPKLCCYWMALLFHIRKSSYGTELWVLIEPCLHLRKYPSLKTESLSVTFNKGIHI